jgi:hypothetical protein
MTSVQALLPCDIVFLWDSLEIEIQVVPIVSNCIRWRGSWDGRSMIERNLYRHVMNTVSNVYTKDIENAVHLNTSQPSSQTKEITLYVVILYRTEIFPATC